MEKSRSGIGKIWLPVAAALALLLLVAALSVSVREISVTGNSHYTDEQIIQILFPDQMSLNSGLCYLRDRLRPHEKIPFVEDYRLVFLGPSRAEVIIYEKSVVGCVSYMSSYMYFDKDGIVVESADGQLPGVPLITGLQFGHIALYQKLPVESEGIFGEIMNLTQILSIYDMKVDRIQYNSQGEAVLYMGGIEVLLGGSGGMNGKIAELNDMLPQLEGRSGTLHLETYDENNGTAGYPFKPRDGLQGRAKKGPKKF